MTVWVLLLGVVCSWWGCAERTNAALPPIQQPGSAVILIPGFYGSRLVDVTDGELLWVSASQGLVGDDSLELPLAELGLAGAQLRPAGLLTEISVVPGVYSIDGYGAMLGAMRTAGWRVVPFDYDWRADLMDTVRQLGATVSALEQEGVKHIALVAHSMGGLVAGYYLRYGVQEIERAVETWEGAERIAAVVMAGVPFEGTMWVFRNMTYGRQVGFNRTLLRAQAIASFPACFYMLPYHGADRLFTIDGVEEQGPIGEADNWSRFHWGLLRQADRLSPELQRRRFDYTASWLGRGRRFGDLLHAPSSRSLGQAKPFMYVSGTGTPTLSSGVWDQQATGPASILFDEDELSSAARHEGLHIHSDGDGTVTVRSATLPQSYRQRFQLVLKSYEGEHTELMNRPDIRQDILGFLTNELARGGGQ